MGDKKEQLKSFNRLLNIMDKLRNECPWDKEQTINSLRHLTIEETFELSDAILDANVEEIKNELGDLLLHIVFYSKIASENNDFNISDVINSVCDKLVDRHPHVYKNISLNDSDKVKKNWELIKKNNSSKGTLSGVPNGLPSLIKAMRVQQKAIGVGFNWKQSKDILNKIKEEIDEFDLELKSNNKIKMEEEFGDILFSLVSYANFNNINSSTALERANLKFIKRFNYVENKSDKINKLISEISSDQLLDFWNESKKS